MAKPGHTATLGLLSVTPSSAHLVDGLLFSRPSAGPRRAARRGQEGRPEEAGSPQSPGAFGAAPDEAARGLRASVAPRRGGEQPGRIWAPVREDLVTQCASSATAPARLPPAHAASLSGIARVARWLGTLRLLSRGGSSATALSRPCPHPTAEAAPTHRRSPRGVPWERGHRNGGVAATRGRPLPSPAAQSCRASEGAAFHSGKASA